MDKYCYENTNTLINNFDLKDNEELHIIERVLVSNRISLLNNKEFYVKGNFDLTHLQKTHKYLFEPVYPWAGTIRECPLAKGNMFCIPEYIVPASTDIFKKLKKEEFYIDYNFNEKLELLSLLYADINALHPFREGNGRSNNMFIKSLALINGINMNITTISEATMANANKKSIKGDIKELYELLLNVSNLASLLEQESFIDNTIEDKRTKEIILRKVKK